MFLLFDTEIILFYDELQSNHKEIWELMRKALSHLFIIYVCIGDFRLILPVVTGRPSVEEVIAATVSSSSYWKELRILTLNENMRLSSLPPQLNDSSTDSDREWIQRQREYGEAILAFGMGNEATRAIILDEDVKEHTQIVGFPGVYLQQSTNL